METPPDHIHSPLMGSLTPVPDPTVLTSQATTAAKEELRRELAYVQQILLERIAGLEKALSALEEMRTNGMRRGEMLREQLRDLHLEYALRVDERFRTMEQRFVGENVRFEGLAHTLDERELRITESRAANQMAVESAFQAQRDMGAAQNANIAQALGRIEASANKQIEQLITLMQTTSNAGNDKVEALKERVTLIEGRTAGITAATYSQQTTQAQGMDSSKFVVAIMVGVSGFLIGLAGIVIALMKP